MTALDRPPIVDEIGSIQASVWSQGDLAEGVAEKVPGLIDRLQAERNPRIAILLGLIAQGNAEPDVERAARDAVRLGLPRYLGLLGERDDALFLSLLFLTAHFPEEKERILGRLRETGRNETNPHWVQLERVLAFQETSPAAAARMSRLVPAEGDGAEDRSWRTIVVSILAPLGAEAAHAALLA